MKSWLPVLGAVLISSTTFATEPSTRRSLATVADLPAPAMAGPLRILLVDDDFSDNNHNPGDTRLSPSDQVFRKLVADAAGARIAWAVETVKPYASGPDIERLRKFSLVLWYTGASYGGNPDNTAVLSIEDEKTVRRYLDEVGGVVVLISPGYVSKVLAADGTWEKAKWPFLNEVLGIRGGHGLAQRFIAGTVKSNDGVQFGVGPGSAVETQFSTVNPDSALTLFTTNLAAAKPGTPGAPVATVRAHGRGRIIYVGFTFENLNPIELAPAFSVLLAATGLSAKPASVAQPAAPPIKTSMKQDIGPSTVKVSGTPTSAVVIWTGPTGTTHPLRVPGTATIGGTAQGSQTVSTPRAPDSGVKVTVERLAPNSPPVLLTSVSMSELKATDPGPLSPGQTLTYRVTLTDATGASGSKEATYTLPLPQDPATLSAVRQADGSVLFTWPEVPGVGSYQIKADDPRFTPVIVRNVTEWRSAALDRRVRRWTVNSVYEPGGSLTAPERWASAQTPTLPSPGAVFLSKPAGAGNTTEAAAHYRRQCGPFPLQDCSADSVLLTSTVWQNGTWGEFQKVPAGPGKPFVFSDVRTYLVPRFYSTSFADVNDLGRGRRVGCATGAAAGYQGPATSVCWATSHGAIPAAGTAVNGAALAQAAEQYNNRNDISLSTIVITPQGALFGAWTPPPPPWRAVNADSPGPGFGTRTLEASMDWWGQSKNDGTPDWLKSRNWDLASLEPWQREAIVAAVATPALSSAFDSQGPKSVPHACLSCHGGRYDASTGWVQGASLLPLIPGDLVFSSPAVRTKPVTPFASRDNYQDSEEAMRGINAFIYRSNPSHAIQQRIKALYSSAGAPETQGMRANDLAVPPGWVAQRGLYQQVIAPYCGSCHFAQSGALSFSSWAEVLQVKQAIQRTVCTEFTMPHSEILFKKFWTQTGAVSLPGLLSTSLGFSQCGP